LLHSFFQTSDSSLVIKKQFKNVLKRMDRRMCSKHTAHNSSELTMTVGSIRGGRHICKECLQKSGSQKLESQSP
jgi:hypothetical protein